MLCEQFVPINTLQRIGKSKQLAFVIYLAIFAFAFQSVTRAQLRNYSITDLGAAVYPVDINDGGQVLCIMEGSPLRTAIYENGVFADIGTLGGAIAGSAINNAGTVVGMSDNFGADYSGPFLYDGSIRPLMIESPGPSQRMISALDINDSGDVVGDAHFIMSTAFSTTGQLASLYDGESVHNLGSPFSPVFVDLGGPPGGPRLGVIDVGYSIAHGVNNHGQVIGVARPPLSDPTDAGVPFFYNDGAIVNLGHLGANAANSINDKGQIVGAGNAGAFIYENGSLEHIPTIGGSHGGANDVNEMEQVVGWSSVAGNVATHAFIYDHDNRKKTVDLNDLIDPTLGWTLRNAVGINSAGKIIGFGVKDGETRAFLLSQSKTFAILVGSDAPGLVEVRDASGNITVLKKPHAIHGDLDVDAVEVALKKWNVESRPSVINRTFDYYDVRNVVAEVESAILSVAAQAQPGDRLIFYYSGHGSGSSAPGANETIEVSDTGRISDTDLTRMLSDSRLSDVSKLVLLDACRSGGFWTGDSAGDSDLETLSHIAIIAAASEDENTPTATGGRGVFTNRILHVLEEPTTNYFSLLAAAYSQSGVPVTGFFKETGFGTTNVVPAYFLSNDFDPNWTIGGVAVPEAHSIVLAFAGVLTCVVGFPRHSIRRC